MEPGLWSLGCGTWIVVALVVEPGLWSPVLWSLGCRYWIVEPGVVEIWIVELWL